MLCVLPIEHLWCHGHYATVFEVAPDPARHETVTALIAAQLLTELLLVSAIARDQIEQIDEHFSLLSALERNETDFVRLLVV